MAGLHSPCLASSIIRLAMTSTAGSLGRSVNPKARRQSSNATIIAFSCSGENELCSIIHAPAPHNHYGRGNLHRTEGFQIRFRTASALASRIMWSPSARNTSHWRERHGLPRNADRPQILLSSLILSALARRLQSRFSLRVRFSDNGTLERSFSTSSQKHCERLAYRGRVSAIPYELGTVKAYQSPTAFGAIKGTPSRENVSTR